MKPRGTPRQSKTKLQESHLNDGQLKEPSRKSLKTVTKADPLQNKPLLGKGFYLDLPFNKKTETLEHDIRILGGTIEKFFSKDIKYLVSNQREARYVQSLGRNSPVPSPGESSLSSPHPSSRRGSHRGSSQGPLDTVITSRGKSLVEKVIKEQERIQINRILSNALEWGIKILYIDDVISYIEKKKRDVNTQDQSKATLPVAKKISKTKTTEKPSFHKYDVGRISKPFVKVEECSRHYKPLYLSIPQLPVLNLGSAPPCSPFYVAENSKDNQEKKFKEHRNKGQKAAGSLRARNKTLEVRGKKRGGYCECCVVKYDSVKAHLNSEQHKAFSKSQEYHVVDRTTLDLTCHFVEIRQQSKRPKCSFSSVVHASVLEGKSEGRRAWPGEVGHTATARCANNTTTHRPRKLSKANPSNSQGSEATKNSHRLVEPSKSVASKCQDDRDYNLTGNHTQENGPVSNAGRLCPSPVTNLRLELADKDFHTASPELLNLGEDPQCPPHSKSLRTASSQHDVTQPVGNQSWDAVPECNLSPLTDASQEKGVVAVGNHLSGPDSPPLRGLRRKVRNFRRLRKLKQNPQQTYKEVPGNTSLQDLWQLFQSSDDMDIEFKGFTV
ncbi:hypothetical protein AGOR_G00204190 [Albula goreensis]|uniref:Protein DBF4 homolog A n=1 Tax=Albula goreensis TaxID=1534307 RepID=A0A8T3CM36_9TELE|nr:hypothetical protein AGOR_G00204190 [Albula goreensis]